MRSRLSDRNFSSGKREKTASVDSLVRNFFLREVWNNVESKKWREVCFTFYSESLETQILHSTIVRNDNRNDKRDIYNEEKIFF